MDKAVLDNYLDNLRAIIAKSGHAIQFVMSSESSPPFAYTIGLLPQIGCELFVIGLPQQVAGGIVNDVALRLKKGMVPDGMDILGIAKGFPMRLRKVSPSDARPHVSVMMQLEPEGYLDVRQILFPDETGHFPGDPKYSHPVTQDARQL